MGRDPSEAPNNQMKSSLINDSYDADEQDR
jgi:hypothetical protein